MGWPPQDVSSKGWTYPLGHTHPPKETWYQRFPPTPWADKHLWNHYLLKTSLAGGKYVLVIQIEGSCDWDICINQDEYSYHRDAFVIQGGCSCDLLALQPYCSESCSPENYRVRIEITGRQQLYQGTHVSNRRCTGKSSCFCLSTDQR